VVQSKGRAAMFKIVVVRCKVDHRQSNELMDVGLGNGIDKRRNKEGRG
jgi:hypothetical protein